ncbi:MAG: transposase [Candidatus Omnitrophica bacterium]|nr:transposase [Candidatus Omnitrophota bacterium]
MPSLDLTLLNCANIYDWLICLYSALEAKVLVERWKIEYNTAKPHSSLNYQPPAPEAIRQE